MSAEGVCNCEAYDCDGSCCGGKCTCAISDEMWHDILSLPLDERVARVKQLVDENDAAR